MKAFEWGGWRFEPGEWRLVNPAAGAVVLPNKSLQLLELLLDRAPALVSKDEILSIVWEGTVVEEGNIAFHVAALRRTIDEPGVTSCIETVRGRGYRFICPVRRDLTQVAEPPVLAEAPQPAVAAEAARQPRVRRGRLAYLLPVALLASAAIGVGWVALASPPAVPAPASNAPNAEALALALRGRAAWRLRTPPSVQQAIGYYERAIVIDPGFALAYAGLADCYNLTMSGLPVDVRARNAKANAERALALDPGLAEAHTSRAFALYKFEWKWDEAEAAFRRAISANPEYALAHHWYGEMLGLLGRFDEAIVRLRRARDLDPASLPLLMDLAGPLLLSGRIAEARAVVEAAAAIDPMFFGVPLRMGEVLMAEGRERESLEETWRSQILRGASLESVEELRAAYRKGGLAAVLRIEIARLEAGGPERFEVPARATFLAGKYARLRDREKTLHWIRVAIDRREDIALHLPTYPEYHWLRGDAEFQRQFARLGIPPPPR